MRKFNICGNNKTIKFDLYWESSIRVTETEIAHGGYDRINSAGDSDATNIISYATFISTNHLIKSTIQLIEKYELKKVVDFKVP